MGPSFCLSQVPSITKCSGAMTEPVMSPLNGGFPSLFLSVTEPRAECSGHSGHKAEHMKMPREKICPPHPLLCSHCGSAAGRQSLESFPVRRVLSCGQSAGVTRTSQGCNCLPCGSGSPSPGPFSSPANECPGSHSSITHWTPSR